MPHSNHASQKLALLKGAVFIPLLLCIVAFGMSTVSFAQTPAGKDITDQNKNPSANTPAGTAPSPGPTTVTTPSPGPTTVTDSSSGDGTLTNPLKFKSLDDLLTGLLAAAINLGAIVLTLALIYTGFRFVAARGNEEKIREARTALMYTIIGGLIILGATAIKEVLQSTISSVTP
jgi:hypothetical protein